MFAALIRIKGMHVPLKYFLQKTLMITYSQRLKKYF